MVTIGLPTRLFSWGAKAPAAQVPKQTALRHDQTLREGKRPDVGEAATGRATHVWVEAGTEQPHQDLFHS